MILKHGTMLSISILCNTLKVVVSNKYIPNIDGIAIKKYDLFYYIKNKNYHSNDLYINSINRRQIDFYRNRIKRLRKYDYAYNAHSLKTIFDYRYMKRSHKK